MVVSKRPKVFEGEGDEEEKPKEPQKSVPKPPCKVLANFYKHVEGPEKHRAERMPVVVLFLLTLAQSWRI